MDRRALLDLESGSYLKKWTGQLPIALIYPNAYPVGMSSLGFQLVYGLLGEMEGIVCERFFYSGPDLPLRSLESGRTLDSFPLVFFSVSFEHDYLNIVRLLLAGGLPPFADNREDRVAAGQPLVVCGGVATGGGPCSGFPCDLSRRPYRRGGEGKPFRPAQRDQSRLPWLLCPVALQPHL